MKKEISFPNINSYLKMVDIVFLKHPKDGLTGQFYLDLVSPIELKAILNV